MYEVTDYIGLLVLIKMSPMDRPRELRPEAMEIFRALRYRRAGAVDIRAHRHPRHRHFAIRGVEVVRLEELRRGLA